MARDTGDAQLQMNRAVKEGLRRIVKAAAQLEKVHERMRVVSSVKELIVKAAKYSPEAAAAWAGICLLFEVCVCVCVRVRVPPAGEASTNFLGASKSGYRVENTPRTGSLITKASASGWRDTDNPRLL